MGQVPGHGGGEGQEEREGEGMRVEQILAPLRSKLGVCGFGVEAHDGREHLGDEKNDEASAKCWAVALLCRSLYAVSMGKHRESLIETAESDLPWLENPTRRPGLLLVSTGRRRPSGYECISSRRDSRRPW
jgi:hypothetical protein